MGGGGKRSLKKCTQSYSEVQLGGLRTMHIQVAHRGSSLTPEVLNSQEVVLVLKNKWGVDLTSKSAVFKVCLCQVSGFSEHPLPRHPFWISPTRVGRIALSSHKG